MADPEIPYYKLGNSIRFDPVEIEAWLKACRVAAERLGDRFMGRGARTSG